MKVSKPNPCQNTKVAVLRPRMRYTKGPQMESASLCTGASLAWAASTKSLMAFTVDSAPELLALTTSAPS